MCQISRDPTRPLPEGCWPPAEHVNEQPGECSHSSRHSDVVHIGGRVAFDQRSCQTQKRQWPQRADQVKLEVSPGIEQGQVDQGEGEASKEESRTASPGLVGLERQPAPPEPPSENVRQAIIPAEQRQADDMPTGECFQKTNVQMMKTNP